MHEDSCYEPSGVLGSGTSAGGYRPVGVPETTNVDVSFNLREKVCRSERKEKSGVWRACLGYVQAAILFLQYVSLYTFLKLKLFTPAQHT